MAKKQFKAESRRLLDLMINSIYTHKEIFLREIISNASDALDKLCYKSLTDDKVGMNREDFHIRVTADKEARTLTVSDNGIGMTAEELESNLGVIARSGSLQFKNEMAEGEKSTDVDIIGQFGVGFYSAFMVSGKVTVISRAYGSDGANMWVSSGTDGYTIKPCEKETVGTDIIMELKPDAEGEDYSEYLEEYRLRNIIKKYSDYVRWPIIMNVTKSRSVEKEVDGEKKTEWESYSEDETINSMVPIWQRPKNEVSDEDCMKFYKEKFYDTEDPAAVIRINAEGAAVSYKAMLFIPVTVPYDYYTRDYQAGLQLYTSGVMIMDKCSELIPECFRFVKGVVDSQDLSLNISRELLQHDRQLKTIAANIEKKIKSELKKLMDNDRETYEKFYKSFGIQLKYGVMGDYGAKKDMLSELLMYYSANSQKLVSLDEYVKAMPEEQKYIYYACGESVGKIDQLPQAEPVKDKGFDILYLTDDVDEFVVQMLGKYGEKEFKSINADDLGLESDEEKDETEKQETENKELLDFVTESLSGRIAAARISHKLKSHPVCLTTQGSVTLEMEKYFAAIPNGQESQLKAQRVLELNVAHPAFAALKSAYESDKEKAKSYAELLYGQALLIAGLTPDNPAEFSELICNLMV